MSPTSRIQPKQRHTPFTVKTGWSTRSESVRKQRGLPRRKKGPRCTAPGKKSIVSVWKARKKQADELVPWAIDFTCIRYAFYLVPLSSFVKKEKQRQISKRLWHITDLSHQRRAEVKGRVYLKDGGRST